MKLILCADSLKNIDRYKCYSVAAFTTIVPSAGKLYKNFWATDRKNENRKVVKIDRGLDVWKSIFVLICVKLMVFRGCSGRR